MKDSPLFSLAFGDTAPARHSQINLSLRSLTRSVHSSLIFALLLLAVALPLHAQRTPHASMWLTAAEGTLVSFLFNGEGEEYVVEWGMDTAWDSEANVLMGTNHIGSEYLTTGRISFQPSDTVDSDGNLSSDQQTDLLSRITHIKESGTTSVTLNCDHEALVSDNYYGKPEEWYKVIKASVVYAQSKGLTVTTIAPFNEPDYVYWGEGDEDDFLDICKLIAADEDLAGIRISAGNTLNCDNASYWYNYMKPYVTEGNTHQLAGTFDSYASFYEEVVADGNHATADELHNVGEAIVGVEYGMQTGIWWGFDGVARGDFCIANTEGGERLGYGEDRDSWTAAAVYRLPAHTSGSADADNRKTEAFIGSSERQATDHTYNFVALDQDVYFDGYGPLRSFAMDIPGGTAYQTGQTNAERMIRITSGDDVPPFYIETDTFIIMNKNSKFVMTIQSGSTTNGTAIVQSTYSGTASKDYQKWIVSMVDPRENGGDYGYYSIGSLKHIGRYLDVLDWSTSTGASIIAYDGELGTNEQWCLEYAGDGDYYIRNHYSGLYLGVKDASTKNGIAVVQQALTGGDHQRWRLIDPSSSRDLTAPSAPSGLVATPQNASVLLSWDDNTEDDDLMGYTILRAEQTEGTLSWQVIGRQITGTEFVDNSLDPTLSYLYKVKAMDIACNSSEASDSVLATVSGDKGLVAKWQFDGNFYDETDNLFDLAFCGDDTTYSSTICKSGDTSISIDGSENFMQVPYRLASLPEMTICAWLFQRDRSTSWQRLFDFGNGTDQYFFLTPYSGSDMRVVLKDGGDEQMITTTRLASSWHHVAVTLDADSICLYVDGELVASSADITIRPADFQPVNCYIGRSQFSADPLMKANIDDFRIYNYALSASELAEVMTELESGIDDILYSGSDSPVVSTEYYSLSGTRLSAPANGIYIQRDLHADGTTTTIKRLQR